MDLGGEMTARGADAWLWWIWLPGTLLFVGAVLWVVALSARAVRHGASPRNSEDRDAFARDDRSR
jgi:hypothetical protein